MLRNRRKPVYGRGVRVFRDSILGPYFAQNFAVLVCGSAAVVTLIAALCRNGSVNPALELFRDCVIVGAAAGLRVALSQNATRD
jgi:hypothetical protein